MTTAKDGRLRGFLEHDARTPTPFRAHLEKEARLLAGKQESLGAPPASPRAVARLEPPEGFVQPTTWKRVAEAPEVLLATHEGWEPVTHELELAWEEKPDGTKYLAVRGPLGRFTWRSNRLEGVKLTSLRIPSPGDGKEGRHG